MQTSIETSITRPIGAGRMFSGLVKDVREYLGTEGLRRAAGIVAGTAIVAVLLPPMLTHLGPGTGGGNIAPMLRDPFTILAWVVLAIAQVSSELMTFRLGRTLAEQGVSDDPMRRSGVIPRTYRQIFGVDALVIGWASRFVSIAFFAVAVVRWFMARPAGPSF